MTEPRLEWHPDAIGYALSDIKTGQRVELDPLTGKFRPSQTHLLDLQWGVAIEDIAAGDRLAYRGPDKVGKLQAQP